MHLWSLGGPRGRSCGWDPPGQRLPAGMRSHWDRRDQLGDGCQDSGKGSDGHCHWAPSWDLGSREGLWPQSFGACHTPVHTWLFSGDGDRAVVLLLG